MIGDPNISYNWDMREDMLQVILKYRHMIYDLMIG
jgi:hypothetical protein